MFGKMPSTLIHIINEVKLWVIMSSTDKTDDQSHDLSIGKLKLISKQTLPSSLGNRPRLKSLIIILTLRINLTKHNLNNYVIDIATKNMKYSTKLFTGSRLQKPQDLRVIQSTPCRIACSVNKKTRPNEIYNSYIQFPSLFKGNKSHTNGIFKFAHSKSRQNKSGII